MERVAAGRDEGLGPSVIERNVEAVREMFRTVEAAVTFDKGRAASGEVPGTDARTRGESALRLREHGAFDETVRWFQRAFAEVRFDEEDVVAAGDRVVLSCVMRGVHCGSLAGVPPTGRPIAVRQIHVFRLAAGRVVEHRLVEDDLSLRLQIGALPW